MVPTKLKKRMEAYPTICVNKGENLELLPPLLIRKKPSPTNSNAMKTVLKDFTLLILNEVRSIFILLRSLLPD